MPKVSIIVPVYKVEKYIGQCIESILSQTFKDFELILVDDGSPDNSGKICDSYAQKDSRIQVIHKTNGGVSLARNVGIAKSTGEWLCFVDSDDTVDKDYIENFGLEQYKSDLFIQGYKKIVKDEVKEVHDFSNFKGNSFIETLAYMEDERIINSPCFKLYSKSIVLSNNIQFDNNTSYGEDHLFSLDYVSNISTAHISRNSGYNYMVYGDESLSHRIVPMNEIVYYTRECRKKQMSILSKTSSIYYLSAINRRLESNITKAIRGLFSNQPMFNEYIQFHDIFSPLIKDKGLYGLCFVRKLFMVIFGYLPKRFTYFILKTIL